MRVKIEKKSLKYKNGRTIWYNFADQTISWYTAKNHFAERISARKTWIQFQEIKSFNVAVRFFVALVTTFSYFSCKFNIIEAHLKNNGLYLHQ